MDAIRLCPYCLRPAPIPASACPHCAHRFAGVNPAGSLPVGTVLAGRYTIGELIRVDGEGILYQGAENHGAFRVTVKEYLPLTLSAERTDGLMLRPKPGSEVLFKTTRMDFADLYRSIQRITPANGLEAVLDVVEANNTVYAVMESPGGRPLQKWLEEHPGPVDPAQAREMLRPVFDGVVAMHRVGLVHRGICPENIRVLENGRARLTGYATVGLRTAGSGLHEQLYEGYSAPEQYSTTEFEGRYTDEYSLAAVVYRMVCGQSPVPAAQRLVSDSNPRARTLERAVPEYVSDVLWMGLQLRPAERIQTVPQLFRALSSQEYTTELTQTLQQAAPRPQSTEEEERKKHILSLRNLLAAILMTVCGSMTTASMTAAAILTLLIVWGLVNQGLHTAKPAESTPASEPASSLVTEPVNLAPDFVGMDYDSQVRNNHSYAGDYLFYVTMEYSDTVEKGKIIRQTPEAGEVIEKGSTIDLVVSRGPQMVEMPNVAGFTRDGAEQQLAQVGLNASFYPIYNDGSYVSGCVAYCSEEPGAMVEVGSTIIVYMAAEVEAEVPATPPETTTPSAGATPSAGQTEPPADSTDYDTD